MSDERPREPDDVDPEDEETDPTWLPSSDEPAPVEVDAADWIDQQRSVPEVDEVDER